MMPNTTNFEFGQVVLVPFPFPFTDQSTTKKRPTIVISSSTYQQERIDLIVIAITSQISSSLRFGEALIVEWQAAGLLKSSIIKPILATIEQQLDYPQIGKTKYS
ncbi:type II toxin-antitoxin system PemK/MazF family toxin [Leptolyngbyaceae cyanobacterium UHCC 1019]